MRWLTGLSPAALLWAALLAFVAGVVAGGGTAWTVQGYRIDAVAAKYDGLVTSTRVLGEAAAADAKRVNELHQQVLKETQNDFNKQLPQVRSGAVAAYRAAHPDRLHGPYPGQGGLPGSAGGVEENDGTGQKCLLDASFITDAAEDALKIDWWQQWARKNNLPVR